MTQLRMRVPNLFRTCGAPLCFLLAIVAIFQPAQALSPDRHLTQALRRIWQVQQGLPDPTIRCVRQLKDGYLYLGTQTGLIRFDGVRFARVSERGGAMEGDGVSLAGRSITDFIETGTGDRWIATNAGGVLWVHGNAAKRFTTADGLPSEQIFQVFQDAAGTIWACTAGGLARWEGERFVAVNTEAALGAVPVRVAAMGTDGRMWVGGESGTVAEWDGKRFIPHVLKASPKYAMVRAMAAGADGAMWIGTTDGLVRWQAGREQLLTTAEGLADNWIFCLSPGADGVLWVGTRNGFSRVRGGAGEAGATGGVGIESFQSQDGLSQSTVYSVCEDREGTLWVGTKHGLNQFLDGRLVPFTASEGLPSNDTGPICQDRNGTIWVGTEGAGLSHFDGKRFETLTTKEGLASNTITALAIGTDNSLWVGMDKGLAQLKAGGVARTYGTTDGLPAAAISSLYCDGEGVLWAGTSGGVAVLRAGRFVPPVAGTRVVHGAVIAFGEREGAVLAASDGGALYRFQGGKCVEASQGEPLLREADAFCIDSEGSCWLATAGGGLRLWDKGAGGNGRVLPITVNEGLFDDDICGIVADGEDRLWMACSKGIFSVSRSELRRVARGEISHVASTPYSPTDAQRTVECKAGVQPVAWRMTSGQLWFSTIHGVIVIDPAHLHRATGPAPAVIEDVIVNGKSEGANAIGTLPPAMRNVEFRYTGLSFVVPVRIAFRYQLEGFDKEWVEAGNRREAFYTNLPPGKFRFRVEARNVEGQWSGAAESAPFVLAPYLYQRAWFWPLCVAVAAAIGWGAYRVRIRTIQSRLRGRTEAILSERSRIARELHDTLLQGFSGVTMEMQALSGRLPESVERGTLMEIIRDATACMKEARRSVAGLRRGRDGEETTGGLSRAIGAMATQLTETHEVRLKLELAERTPALPADVEYNLVRIAQEAVTNAVKHSGGRVIEVSLTSEGEQVRLVVRDDGRGFEGEMNGSAGGGAGHYGLVGMRERAGAIGGELKVQTAVGGGTVVEMWLRGNGKEV